MTEPLLFSRCFGNDKLPKLIILHGLFGSSENWQSIATDLATNYQVYLLDLRNHGQSFHHPSMDYKAMADDIHHFLVSKGIDKTHILGHSMGGKVAMMMAFCYPDCIDRLIVVDIAPIVYQQPQHAKLIQAMQMIDLSKFTSRLGVNKALQEAIPNTTIRQFLLKNLKQKKSTLQWQINLQTLQQEIDIILGFSTPSQITYHKPTLFLNGALSDYVQKEHHIYIRQLFTNVQILAVKHAGHWVQADNPKVFKEMVRWFLS